MGILDFAVVALGPAMIAGGIAGFVLVARRKGEGRSIAWLVVISALLVLLGMTLAILACGFYILMSFFFLPANP